MRVAYRSYVLLSIAAALTVLGCESSPTTPMGLLVEVEVSTDVVSVGESFLATLSVTNPHEKEVVLHSGNTCFTVLSVHRDGVRLNWKGADFGCYTVPKAFPIPPSESFTREFALEAWIMNDHGQYQIPPPPGSYELRFEMEVSELADEARVFTVRG